jgi:hypothetical protein
MSLRLHRTSAGLDPASLRPGTDLVLEVAREHALALPDGVAIEDHLNPTDRLDVDAAALRALAAWRAERGDQLRVDGIDLGHVAEVELIAVCFLPAELIRRGLEAVGAPDRIHANGFDPQALAALGALAPDGCEVDGDPAPPPPAPPRAGRRHALIAAVENTPIRPWPRGGVICVPYWHLVGVYTALARRRRGPRPVPAGMGLSGLRRVDVLRALIRGGWGGSSGARARAAAAARVKARLAQLAADPVGADERARALDRWALSVTARDAGAAPAQLAHFSRAVRGARLIVTPFDSPGEQRALIAAGHANDTPALVVQHGYKAGLNDPDLTLSDHVAVWSSHDRDNLAGRAAGRILVTGNPGGDETVGRAALPHGSGRTIVLFDYQGRLSAQVGTRIALEHVATALRGLAAARPGSDVVLRPHPFDDRNDHYESALASDRGDLRLSLDDTTPIEDLLLSADLCVGALSTATLQSAALGVPTVFLDVSGAPRPWPFDGSPGALALARNADELAARIGVATADTTAAAEALGLTGRATQSILGLIDELAG